MAETLREYRLRCGATLAEWTVRTDVDEATFSRVERGKQEPRPDTIIKIARGLGLSANRVAEMIRAGIATSIESQAS